MTQISDQTFNLQKDPFYLLEILEELEAGLQVEKPHTYPHFIPVDEINYPDYR